MSIEDQGHLLMFVTSCSRQPLLGFGQLDPPFCMQKIPTHESGSIDEENRRALSAGGTTSGSSGSTSGSSVYAPYINPAKLPSAGTCMNLLKLPEYYSIDMLRDKLLYAIRSNSGFELT